MNTDIKSKHAVVPVAPAELYMRFVDMRNFVQNVPEYNGMKIELTGDYDTLHAKVQGFDIGARVTSRQPYSKIVFADDGAPFNFEVTANFGEVDGEPGKTDLSVEFAAELNVMMKMMLKSKIQEGLDKFVDGLAGAKI